MAKAKAKTMGKIGQLRRLGYRVEQAQGPDYDENGEEIVYVRDGQPVENPPLVWFVAYPEDGSILANHVPDGDDRAWDRLLEPAAHELRVQLARHSDPNDELELSREQIADLQVDALIEVGDVTIKEGEALRAALLGEAV